MDAEESIQRYQTLLDTARSLGRAMDLNELIDEILNRAEEVMAAETCSLLLPDEHTIAARLRDLAAF